jgi:hypothetical protein
MPNSATSEAISQSSLAQPSSSHSWRLSTPHVRNHSSQCIMSPVPEAARKPSAGVARVKAPSPDPSTPAASPSIPPSRPPCSSSAIASIFVTKSESIFEFQPGYMHLKTDRCWGALHGRRVCAMQRIAEARAAACCVPAAGRGAWHCPLLAAGPAHATANRKWKSPARRTELHRTRGGTPTLLASPRIGRRAARR